MLGIAMAFWIGMGVVAAIVVAGCAVAWLMPPRKGEQDRELPAVADHKDAVLESY